MKKAAACATGALIFYIVIFILIRSFADMNNTFWLSAFTMRARMGYDYTAFRLFGPLHISELILVLVISVISYQVFKRASADAQNLTLKVLAVVIACEELLKDTVMLATGQFEWEHLPFHLCGVNIFIALWYAYSRRDYLAEFLYVFGLSGTWVALITTSWQACPLWNFSHLHSVFFHMLLAVFCILVIAGGHRPHIGNIGKVFGVLCLTIIPAVVFDCLVKTNFFFLCETENNPVLELISSLCGRFYLAGLALLALAGMIVMYIPWIVRDIVIRMKSGNEQNKSE